ncbi:MAG: hypothetical protein GEU98_26950 [Pseudonocardiaceae bacterium]|nr:hypothetical protein [Pseudonocardiaceae bacterium]
MAGLNKPGSRPRPEEATGPEETTGQGEATGQGETTGQGEAAGPQEESAEAAAPERPRSTETAAEQTTELRTAETTEEQVVAPPVIGQETTEAERTSGGTEAAETERPAEPATPRPRPSGKSRATGVARPRDLSHAERETTTESTADSGEGEATEEPAEADRQASGRSPVKLAAVLAVIALGLAALAFWFRTEAASLEGPTDNEALINPARTSEVKEQVGTAVESLFSYNYTDTAKTERAAKDILAGDKVRADYDKLFKQIKELAPKQQLVVSLKVVRSAVVRLEDDRARVLVFADQTNTRGSNGQTAAGGAQVAVSAQQIDGRWKITDLDLFNQQTPSAPAQGGG